MGTPVRSDGAEGEPYVAEVGPIQISRRVVNLVRDMLFQDKAAFEVKYKPAVGSDDFLPGDLKIKGKKIGLYKRGKKKAVFKSQFSDQLRIYLHPLHKSLVKIDVDATTSFIMDCEDHSARDVIAVAISFFAKRERRERAGA